MINIFKKYLKKLKIKTIININKLFIFQKKKSYFAKYSQNNLLTPRKIIFNKKILIYKTYY